MESIALRARAKINVGLDVLRRRDDGYHDMRMVMQTVNLFDVIYIKKISKPVIKLSCNLKWMPTDERNLVYAAAQRLFERFDIPGGVFIELTKNIPVAAGLAGGSSDCGAALIGIRRLFGLALSDAELMVLGAELGADVPFCIMRGTALAEGIGDRLQRLRPHPPVFVLLAKPPVAVSTASVFKALDLNAVRRRPDIDAIISGINAGSLNIITGAMGNVLESVTEVKYPMIGELKRLMLDNGAEVSLMSGSGPTVFGYFPFRLDMQRAYAAIRSQLPEVHDVFQTFTFNP